MSEQLAIIKNFNIGVGDRGVPAIWFNTYITEHSAALQVIDGDRQIWDFINDAGLKDITQINGRSCWVEVNANTIRFLRMAKI